MSIKKDPIIYSDTKQNQITDIKDNDNLNINKNIKKDEKYEKIGNYRILKDIGEGAFGKVKLGIHIPTDEYVAIKILERNKITENEDVHKVIREINILKKLNHPNIIKIYEVSYII